MSGTHEPLWRIELLGSLAAKRGELVVSRFRTRRVALLLGRLACPPNRPHSRDELADLLWPDTDPEVSRRNLRQALSSLRNVLEPPEVAHGSVLQVHQGSLQLAPGRAVSDVEEFETCLSRARWKKTPEDAFPLLVQAVDLYRGDLLPGFTEEWALMERLRLEDQYVQALRSLVSLCLELGRDEDALPYLRMALAKEPLNEEWHLGLMRQYLRSARPNNAIRQFEELRSQLQEGLGLEPSREARELLSEAKLRIRLPSSPVPASPAPPSSPAGATRRPNNLPITLNRFCGREEEIRDIQADLQLPTTRLVTLLGPAGTGKTRLSAELGHQYLRSEAGEVCFVPLADLTPEGSVLEAILDALRARGVGTQDAWNRLLDILSESPQQLLILDNFEHVLESATPWVEQLLELSPVRILVTSRHPLGLAAEHRYELSPLPFPREFEDIPEVSRGELAGLLEYPSVRLYVDRCQAVRPDFQITSGNAAAIVGICSRLDGMPLAIELAAGLSATFSPRQILRHIQERLISLSSRRRDVPARHRSLRAAVDTSYATLPPEVQRSYAALSVFRGGFTLEAAHRVCFDANVTSEECLDVLIRLQEHSLLRSDPDADESAIRFQMLESFREFGDETLSKPERADLRRRHAGYFRQDPLILHASLPRDARTQRHLEIEKDFENYMAAAEFFAQSGDAEATFDVLKVVASTWLSRGPRIVERRAIRNLAQGPLRSQMAPAKQVELLRMLGTTYIRSAEHHLARQACEEALQIAKEFELADMVPYCHAGLATCAGFLGELDECERQSRLALETMVRDDLALTARAHLGIGAVYWGRGEVEASEAAYLLAAEASAQLRDGEPDPYILCNLARVDLDLGRHDGAMRRLGAAIQICRRLNDHLGLALCQSLVGRYHWLQSNLPSALEATAESLPLYRDAGFSHLGRVGVSQHALVLVELGEWEASATLLAATSEVVRVARILDEKCHSEARKRVESELPRDAFTTAWAAGLAMTDAEMYRFALRFVTC